MRATDCKVPNWLDTKTVRLIGLAPTLLQHGGRRRFGETGVLANADSAHDKKTHRHPTFYDFPEELKSM